MCAKTINPLCAGDKAFFVKYQAQGGNPNPHERLFGLCMMSVHREKISKDEQDFIERVVDPFG